MEFGKKKGMSEVEKKAKLAALKGTRDWATDSLKGKLGGLKKVTVAADSKEGLEEGLETAQDVLEDAEECEECGTEGCPACEESGLGEQEIAKQRGFGKQQKESEPMDEDALDAKIAELMKMKEKLQRE